MSSKLLSEMNTEGVLRLTMNRPDMHNAFDDQQIQRLIAALEQIAGTPDVRVLIIASNGKSFCAGADVNYMRRMGNNSHRDNLADAAQLARLMQLLDALPLPTIARVQGAAMGGGVGLLCCCDYAIGSPRARLALSEVKIGMVPATISPYVVRTIGEKAARRLFMSGQSVDAAEAKSLGFLSALVAEEELDGAVDELAQTLLNNAPKCVALAKQLAVDVSHGPVTTQMITDTIKLIADVRDSDEGREGLSAFLQKRRPVWIKH